MKNQDIRQEAKAAKIRLWMIADRLGMQDSYFSRLLRHELAETEKNKIRAIITELKGAQ